MLTMLLHNSPGLLSQLGVGATMLEQELERRQKAKDLQVCCLLLKLFTVLCCLLYVACVV